MNYGVGNLSLVLSARIGKFMTDMDRAEKRVRTFASTARSTSQAMMGAGMMMTSALSLPLGLIGGGALKEFTQFEEMMRNVNTINRQTEDEFKRTSAIIQDLSVEYGKNATEVAGALYHVVSASFKGAEALDVMTNVLVASRAGLADVESTGWALVSVLRAYGLGAEYATDVSDIMFKTVERGLLTFDQMAKYQGNAIATAAASGVAFDEVGAAIATMTKGGIRAGEAFTALNRMMIRLTQSSPELDRLFTRYGEIVGKDYKTGYDVMQAEGIAKAMEVIVAATGGATDKLNQLGFMVRDLRAAQSLSREGGRAFAEELVQVGERANRADSSIKALKEQAKSLAFQLHRFKALWSNMQIDIGSVLASPLRDVTAILGSLFNMFRGLSDTTKKVLVYVGLIVASLGPMLLIVGAFSFAITNIVIAFGTILPIVAGFMISLGKVAILAGLIGVEFTVLKRIFASNLNILEMIKEVIAGIVDWIGSGDWVKTLVAGIGWVAKIMLGIKAGFEIAVMYVEWYYTTFFKVITNLGHLFARLGNIWDDVLINRLTDVITIVGAIMPKISKIILTSISDTVFSAKKIFKALLSNPFSEKGREAMVDKLLGGINKDIAKEINGIDFSKLIKNATKVGGGTSIAESVKSAITGFMKDAGIQTPKQAGIWKGEKIQEVLDKFGKSVGKVDKGLGLWLIKIAEFMKDPQLPTATKWFDEFTGKGNKFVTDPRYDGIWNEEKKKKETSFNGDYSAAIMGSVEDIKRNREMSLFENMDKHLENIDNATKENSTTGAGIFNLLNNKGIKMDVPVINL